MRRSVISCIAVSTAASGEMSHSRARMAARAGIARTPSGLSARARTMPRSDRTPSSSSPSITSTAPMLFSWRMPTTWAIGMSGGTRISLFSFAARMRWTLIRSSLLAEVYLFDPLTTGAGQQGQRPEADGGFASGVPDSR